MNWPLIFGLSYFGALGLIWAFLHGAAKLRDAKGRRVKPRLYVGLDYKRGKK